MSINTTERIKKKNKGFYIFINATHPDHGIDKVWSLGPFLKSITVESMIREFTELHTSDRTYEYFTRGTSWIHGFLINYYTVTYVDNEGIEYECEIRLDE